jgi:uncharacterized protein (TIRG00374 family)
VSHPKKYMPDLETGDRRLGLAYLLRLGLSLLGITAFLYAALLMGFSTGDTSNLLSVVSWGQVALAIGLVSLGVAIRGARWCYFLRSLSVPLPIVPSLVAFTASFALTATPGKAGELVKSALLRVRYGVPITQTAGILIVERFGDFAALLLLGAIGLTLFVDIGAYFLFCVLIVVGTFICLQRPFLVKKALSPLAHFSQARPIIERLSGVYSATSRLLSPGTLLVGEAFAVVAWSCEGFALYVLTHSLPTEVPLYASVSIFALSSIAGALSMLPGGLGSFEAVMIILLTQIGVTSAMAAVVVVAFRLCTIYFVTLLGLASLAIWRFMPGAPVTRKRQQKPLYPATDSFESASVILPVIDETYSLSRTVDDILAEASCDICEFLIVVCDRTTRPSLKVVQDLRRRLGSLVVVHHQSLPFLGGAIREAFDLARGSHVIMMASDLETDPLDVKSLIEQARNRPDAIITASRWCSGGAFDGYDRTKLIANKIFQALFSMLYASRLSDMTYGYRLFPTNLVRSIKWEELRHAFLFETIVKPLRLGVPVVEIPSVWRARREGKSQNTMMQSFIYFRTGLRTRVARRCSLIRLLP